MAKSRGRPRKNAVKEKQPSSRASSSSSRSSSCSLKNPVPPSCSVSSSPTILVSSPATVPLQRQEGSWAAIVGRSSKGQSSSGPLKKSVPVTIPLAKVYADCRCWCPCECFEVSGWCKLDCR
ncbi:unnamed protein product [Amaranthus hypochondriacus]